MLLSNASYGQLDRLSFGELRRTPVVPVLVDVDERGLIPVALVSAAAPDAATLFIDVELSDPLVEIGFEVDGSLATSARVAADHFVPLVARNKPRSDSTAIPLSAEIQCRITRALRAPGTRRQKDDWLTIRLDFVSGELPRPKFKLEPKEMLRLIAAGTSGEEDAIAVGVIEFVQPAMAARYSGAPTGLQIDIEAWLESERIRPAAVVTRIRYGAATGATREDVGLWGSSRDIPLPFAAHGGEGENRAELEIGIEANEIKGLARALKMSSPASARPGAENDAEAGQWNGTLRLEVNLRRTDGVDTPQNVGARIPVSADLSQTLRVDIQGIGAVTVPLGSPASPSRVSTEPYKRTIRKIPRIQANIQPELTLVMSADVRDRDPRVDIEVQASCDARVSAPWTVADVALPVSTRPDAARSRPPLHPNEAAAEVQISFGERLKEIGLTDPDPVSGLVPKHGRFEIILSYRGAANLPVSARAIVVVPLEIETAAPTWLACIDLGTSSTAVWLGRTQSSGPNSPLPLGAWLHRIDKDHDEWSSDNRPDQEQILMPSHIGLASNANLRARFDALSLGNLSLAGDDRAAVGRRLAALDRHYDISIPFAPRMDMPLHADKIIFDPKRKLIASSPVVSMLTPVFRAAGEREPILTTDVVLSDLMKDYFNEVGSYIVPRALHELVRLETNSARQSSSRELLDRWISGLDQLGVVLTHPSGLRDSCKAMYEEAGRHFLAAMTAGCSRRAEPAGGWVKLVPEALAAALYGINNAIATQSIKDGEHNFGALDIGAGTYDVTLVQAYVQGGALERWRVRSHFGVTVGGLDLDRAVASRVLELLRSGADEYGQRLFDFNLGLPTSATDLASQQATARARGQKYLRALRMAKQELTKELLKNPRYEWKPAKDAPRLDVVVGVANEADWPVRATSEALGLGANRRFPIPDQDAFLTIEQRSDGIRVILSIGPDVFQLPRSMRREDPGTIVELMGEALPAMTMAEVKRLQLSSPRWIITGRAALWPPLYQAVRNAVRSSGGAHPVPEKPFDPDRMKEAVLLGAIGLAQQPHLDLGTDVLNALAVVTYGGPGEAGPAESWFDMPLIRSVTYLNDSAERHEGSLSLKTRGRFAIVRALPGLDEEATRDRRIQLFRILGIKPWVSIGDDVFPAHFRPGGQHQYALHWIRQGGHIFIKVSDEAAGEVLGIGPIECDGRIYGDY
ncbi:MAG: hypothetical protein E6G97_21640 [Alphaproteobacteria bacterium]|nr:MAG: hypothetical protein E6G97_21640 [Alphaproteobacteria bacterium]